MNLKLEKFHSFAKKIFITHRNLLVTERDLDPPTFLDPDSARILDRSKDPDPDSSKPSQTLREATQYYEGNYSNGRVILLQIRDRVAGGVSKRFVTLGSGF